MSGTLYGIGVGPGDPELMTLKAHRLIVSVPVIAYPAPDVGESFTAALVRPPIAPGTLSLFNGYRSLHRVAPIPGPGARIMALFNYMAEPGYVFSADIHEKFFGRRDGAPAPSRT